ncbi:hypothetical protein, partial [Streptomyces niveiscabiei]|uniref:hypothetical protein n=1 Tax=Streptomyces niveiscabiei TaxID=164115 RepID=UPI00197D707D
NDHPARGERSSSRARAGWSFSVLLGSRTAVRVLLVPGAHSRLRLPLCGISTISPGVTLGEVVRH